MFARRGRSRTSLLLLVALGALTPFMVALAPDREARAAISVAVEVHGGATSQLNCQWHPAFDACGTGTGSALDWANAQGSNVYLRTRSYRSDATWTIGSGTIIDRSGPTGCYRVDVDIVDDFGFAKGSLIYLHTQTWTPGWIVTISGSPGGYWQQWIVGFTSDHVKEQAARLHDHGGAPSSGRQFVLDTGVLAVPSSG